MYTPYYGVFPAVEITHWKKKGDWRVGLLELTSPYLRIRIPTTYELGTKGQDHVQGERRGGATD